eukprot:scaffold10070_cov47-Prasinocladus_malaysianus.AAC.1
MLRIEDKIEPSDATKAYRDKRAKGAIAPASRVEGRRPLVVVEGGRAGWIRHGAEGHHVQPAVDACSEDLLGGLAKVDGGDGPLVQGRQPWRKAGVVLIGTTKHLCPDHHQKE